MAIGEYDVVAFMFAVSCVEWMVDMEAFVINWKF